jgi:LmbE family N-acetylglucosaminyl deacetylase
VTAGNATSSSIFVQPHFDDVALSCGGTVARLVAEGQQVTIVTVFAERPPADSPVSALAAQLEQEWGAGPRAALVRRAEDTAAAAVLGARPRCLAHRDAIYRGERYETYQSLMGEVHPADLALVDEIGAELAALWRGTTNAVVYLPLAIGNHVDHQLCYRLGRSLGGIGARVLFYEDFPYVTKPNALSERLRRVTHRPDARAVDITATIVDITATIEVRLRAIAAYASQLRALFPRRPFEKDVREYAAGVSGVPGQYAERLWAIV